MIAEERIHHLKTARLKPGKYVLYWMQQARRTHYNHALEYAIAKANELQLPLVTGVVLDETAPDANLRHYTFMLEGLRDLIPELQRRNIQFVLRIGGMPREVAELAQGAAMLVGDWGYLRFQRAWRQQIAEELDCPVVFVETDVVVPVETASSKEEIAARTLRPKLHKCSERFLLAPFGEADCRYGELLLAMRSVDITQPEAVLQELTLNRSIVPAHGFKGGWGEAKRRLEEFINEKLDEYHNCSNDPARDILSRLSPYLRFGQISPIEVILRIEEAAGNRKAKEAFLEQLIVRRELSRNFVYYTPGYDHYEDAVPEWARRTLAEHQQDERPYLYSFSQLENADTHDVYWNAAQQEMLITGHMHKYMRMYWGKKIIEWSKTPEEAFYTMLSLNNSYELDGHDPNAFTGTAWCFGRHDHPWKEREVFGKVRYMNAKGLTRKFQISRYVARINTLVRAG
ncbi:deoxyribodipyrimidine photolyase [candidate division KSB3 bacterium]|uniref:Deoxyribodipyrimidine photo-lyase n=1 Tax=candidate division KSB3 bacterium TaxID=2044937 RepID=A0A2G6E815_9BACT|nr:MAG: deoxyribodipyrimidine photolyase [candidate division KSB3 bacterium]PIE30534.1 MAG: deoxyribodipyrimidine photolyase [candidate division KSB3 bacterium]